MNSFQKKKLYRRAMKEFGLQAQLGMLMEESAELIQATNKVLRYGTEGSIIYDILASEMADVEIMIEQIKQHYDSKNLAVKVEEHKQKKLENLKKVLDAIKIIKEEKQ